MMRFIDSWLGIDTPPDQPWRERGRRLRGKIALRTRLLRATYLTIDNTALALYWLWSKLRAKKAVTSVLHLSLISHKPFMLSRAMREQGLKSEYFAINADAAPTLNVGWDYAIPSNVPPQRRRMLESFYLWTVLARYDVIHSHFKTFLSHEGWELPYLKRLGKVLVIHARGCDFRYRSLNMARRPALNICQECDYPVGSCDTEYQHSRVATAERFGDVFFVTTPDLRDFVRDSEHVPFIHPVGVDFEAIVPAPRDPDVFRVVTSSNHPGIDGIRFIREAVARLQQEGRAIELIEVRKMGYAQALAVYKSADVYAGKLRMGYYNNANIETMMLGVPNMSYISEEFQSLVPDSPIIVTTPSTIESRLRYFIDHRDELKAIGARGPAFVRRHHDPSTLVRHMIDRYNEAFRGARGAPHEGLVALDGSARRS